MNEAKIEVVILSGFLGSGKTTLLKQIIEQEEAASRKYAVLMNEIGQVSIDSDILGGNVPIEEIVNGCICCTSKSQLEQSLLTLILGETPERIYIEGSGVAHPMEIFDTCLSPIVASLIRVKSIITLVDAKQWLSKNLLSSKTRRLLEEQVKYADQILVNKVDLIDAEGYEKIQADLQEINPFSKKKMTTFARFNLEEMIEREEKEREVYEAFHVNEKLHISSMTYQFQQPINRQMFLDWLQNIPNTIYRVKGFLRFTEEPKYTYLLQYSYGVHFLIEVDIMFSMNVVLIGERLEKNELKQQLQVIEFEKDEMYEKN